MQQNTLRVNEEGENRKGKVNFTFHTWIILLPSENTGKQRAKHKHS